MYPQFGQTILHLISRMIAPHTQQLWTGGSCAISGGIVSAMSRPLQPVGGCVALLLLAGILGSACARVTLDTVRADVAAGQGHLIGTVPFIAHALGVEPEPAEIDDADFEQLWTIALRTSPLRFRFGRHPAAPRAATAAP